MERCSLVSYAVVLDILHYLLTHMFIHCSYKCKSTTADLNQVVHRSLIGVQHEDGTNVLCRNFVTLFPDHTPDVPKGWPSRVPHIS